MNFDKVAIKKDDDKETLVTSDEFMAIPLGQRIKLVTTSRVRFFMNGQQISALDALRRPK